MQKRVLCERPLKITSAVGLYIGALGTLLDQIGFNGCTV